MLSLCTYTNFLTVTSRMVLFIDCCLLLSLLLPHANRYASLQIDACNKALMFNDTIVSDNVQFRFIQFATFKFGTDIGVVELKQCWSHYLKSSSPIGYNQVWWVIVWEFWNSFDLEYDIRNVFLYSTVLQGLVDEVGATVDYRTCRSAFLWTHCHCFTTTQLITTQVHVCSVNVLGGPSWQVTQSVCARAQWTLQFALSSFIEPIFRRWEMKRIFVFKPLQLVSKLSLAPWSTPVALEFTPFFLTNSWFFHSFILSCRLITHNH